jgi:hypothetical protein
MQRFDLKRFRLDRKLTQFVLSQIINAPVTTIPTVKIAPNISIS